MRKKIIWRKHIDTYKDAVVVLQALASEYFAPYLLWVLDLHLLQNVMIFINPSTTLDEIHVLQKFWTVVYTDILNKSESMICIHMPVSRLVLVDFIQDMDEIHCCQTSCIPPGHGCLDWVAVFPKSFRRRKLLQPYAFSRKVSKVFETVSYSISNAVYNWWTQEEMKKVRKILVPWRKQNAP